MSPGRGRTSNWARTAIRSARRLQDPPAEEFGTGKTDPEAQTVTSDGQTAAVARTDLVTAHRPPGQVSHYLGIRIERDLKL
jgi:hypothetical protein